MTLRAADVRFPQGHPSPAARELILRLLDECGGQRAGYEACIGSEWMRANNRHWILADNRFVYEISAVESQYLIR